MKKDEKNGSAGRTICTISLSTSSSASTEKETPGLRRLNRESPSKKPIAPASNTRKSERLTPSPASVTKKSGRMETKNTASPLRRSDKGKNVFSENSKGSDKSDRNASDTEESKDEMINNIEESTNKIKKREPKMTGRSYRALFRGQLKKEISASSNDEELVVVGCSRRVPAGNDDAREGNTDCPPHADSESKRLPVGKTSLEKGPDSPLKLIRDTEKMVLDAPSVVETGDDSVKGSQSENSETHKLLVCKTSLENDIDFPLKRKKDTAGVVLDASAAVADADDRIMSSGGVLPSPSEYKYKNRPEMCSKCGKRQKVNGDFENLSDCSCIAQPVQESDHVSQDMKETGPATSRDCGENMRNMQQDKSYDPKLSSMYPEYWVPVQLSDVQLEQYCRTLFSKSLSLSSLLKNDLVGVLEETLTSVRKTCDHPYVMDASLKPLLTKNLELHEFLDVEVKASGKLHLLDAMLTQIKKNGLKAVVFYQATQCHDGLLLGNILEDFVSQRFGQNSYEHGVCVAKKSAINNFNKESQCFVLLLEIRACSQSIKLLRAEAFILFGSSLNPAHDVKLLERIKIQSYPERTKIFRMYSTCTIEEKALILARQNKPLENLNRPLTHALLMWGASYLFDKLDLFHGSETPDSGAPFEQSIEDSVIHEFSSILSSKVGGKKEDKMCLVSEAKHAHGTYSTDSTLFGEEHVKLSDEDSPNLFWEKLLGGKNPMWKYCSSTSQRSRKRVRYLQVSEETARIGNGQNLKKRKKASDDVIVNNNERKASGKDLMGVLESPKVIALESSRRSASGTSVTLNGNDAFGSYSLGGHISGIPEDMLACIDWRQVPCESQRSLHAVLKPQMAKLCQVLHLSEKSTSMVENFLEYVIENHRVCKEPATTLQAFQIALSWIAASLVEQKLNNEESLVRAKYELSFNCSREEVDYLYSILYCMKSLFWERTQGATVCQEKDNTKLLRSSEGEVCMTETSAGHYSSATKDIEKALSDIKKKCKKRLQNLKEKHEEKKLELVNMYADKKGKLENEKAVERAVIRIQCIGISTQSLLDGQKRLDHDYEKKFDEITSERDKCLKILEQMHEAAKKKLAEDEACWISRVENWAQAESQNYAPIKSGTNKHFSGIYSSNTSKNAPEVQTYNDVNGEATKADTNCMVSNGNQVPEAENTLGTMSGGNTQQVASRNDKAMDVTTLSPEQPTDNVATKSLSDEHASITAPENLIPAGCQGEYVGLNVNLAEYQISDRITSAAPNEDVSSSMTEISQSLANLTKSVSPEFSMIREEALVTIENTITNHVDSDADNILDQQNEEACSIDKEIPDELALPMPQPASVVKSSGSAESDRDDQDTCPIPSSGGKQPDPAASIQGQTIEAAIEPQPAGSPIYFSPAGQQPEPAENIQGQNIEAAIEPHAAGSPMPSSPAGQQPESAANVQGQNTEAGIEPQAAGSPMPSSSAGQQPEAAANIQGQNIEAEIEPQAARSETVETGGFTALDQDDQVAFPLPSSPAGNQPDTAANMEGQNINTSAEIHIAGPDAVEIGDSAVSDKENMVAQDASSLPPSLVGTQADLEANTEGQNISTVAQLYTAGSDTVETGGSAVSDQPTEGSDQDASPLPLSLNINHPDASINTEDQNNTTVAEPRATGSGSGSDACEMEIAEPGPQGDHSSFANNIAQLSHEGGVEPSAGVTAPVPSLLNNGTEQSSVQPVPQIPFPVFSDPFHHELEKLRRESENSKKTYEEKKSILKAELERKMAEVQAEYQRKFKEVEAEHNTRAMEIETNKKFVIMNKLLANGFLFKCTKKNASYFTTAPRGRIQQLAHRAAQVSSLRNYTTLAPAPAPPQPQVSSFPCSVPRPSSIPLNPTLCPMPHISNTNPSLSASPATNPIVNARLRSPAPHLNSYRPSSSIPILATTPTSSLLPQALKHSTVLIQQQQQQQQQQQNLGSGLQRSNDLVCLSDDE